MIARLLLVIASTALAGCFFNDSITCTTEAVVSVRVTVRDAQDAPVTTAIAQFRRPGDAFEACDTNTFDAGTFSCAYEVEGTLEISVTAPGFAPFTSTVQVDGDECHVETETVDVVLEPQ